VKRMVVKQVPVTVQKKEAPSAKAQKGVSGAKAVTIAPQKVQVKEVKKATTTLPKQPATAPEKIPQKPVTTPATTSVQHVPPSATPQPVSPRRETTIRRNALQVRKAVEQEEKELIEQEKVWETPAIFRKNK